MKKFAFESKYDKLTGRLSAVTLGTYAKSPIPRTPTRILDGIDDMNFFHKYVPFFLGHKEAQYRLAALDYLLLKSLKDDFKIETSSIKQLFSMFDDYWAQLPKQLPRASVLWSPKGQEPLFVVKKIGSIFRNASWIEENRENLLIDNKVIGIALRLSSLISLDTDFETITFDLFTNLSPQVDLGKEDKKQIMNFFESFLYHRDVTLSSMAADILLLLCQQSSNCSYFIDQPSECLFPLFQHLESLLFRGSSDLLFTTASILFSLLSVCNKEQKESIATKTHLIKSLIVCLGNLSRDTNTELLEKVLYTIGLFLTEPSLVDYYLVYEPIFFQFCHDRTELNLTNDRPLFLVTELIAEASFLYHPKKELEI